MSASEGHGASASHNVLEKWGVFWHNRALVLCFYLFVFIAWDFKIAHILPQLYQKDLRLGSCFEKTLSQPFLETIWVVKQKSDDELGIHQCSWRQGGKWQIQAEGDRHCQGFSFVLLQVSRASLDRLKVQIVLLFCGQNPCGGWVCTWWMSLAWLTHLQADLLCLPGWCDSNSLVSYWRGNFLCQNCLVRQVPGKKKQNSWGT